MTKSLRDALKALSAALLLTAIFASPAAAQEGECDPETAIIPCEEPPTVVFSHPNPAIPACEEPASPFGCTAIAGTGCYDCGSCAIYDSADLDCDTIPDSLELSLARKFFPHLYVRYFNSDLRQFYGYGVAEPERAIPFSVNPLPGGSGLCLETHQCLEIRYGVAYNWDCGDNPNDGCDGGLIFGIGGAHRGDSELYAAYVARKDPTGAGAWGVSWSTARSSASYWRLIIDYTSAHQGEITDSSAYGIYGGLTVPAKIYAAEGKHAMYHTPGFCDGGAATADYCQANYNLRGCYSSLGYCYSQGFFFNIGSSDQLNYYNTKGSDGSTIKAWTYAPSSRWGTPDAVDGIYYFWGSGDFGDASAFRPKFEDPFLWTTVHSCFMGPWGSPCGDIFSYNGRTGIRLDAGDLFDPSCGCF